MGASMKTKARKANANTPERPAPQRGGTLLGLLIGVVLGLGIALGVAVYVTKVPIPFTSKGPTRNADQDAAEARKNKDWDPNAPLYGRNPAKPVVPNPEPAATPAPEVAASGQRPLVAPAAAADPLGDLATARAAAARTPASPVAAAPAAAPAAPAAPAGGEAADPFTYFVQVGAFRAVEEAESQRARLSLGGIEARVSEREQSGRTVYRVRVGPFDKRGDADRTKERLETLGMEAALVRVQR